MISQPNTAFHVDRCAPPEQWCVDLKPPRCSQFGKCLDIGLSPSVSSSASSDNFAASVVLKGSSAAVSNLSPVITLLGSGTRVLVSSGGTAMFDEVPYMSL